MSEVLVDVKNLKKYFPTGEKGKTVKAVDDISFQIYKGETLGVVGESGCGKSTKRKSTAAPGECASQYTGCCHYRSPLFQAATVLQKTAPEAARKTGIFSIFGSFTPLIIISSTGSHHVSIPCDLRCP